MVKLCTLSLPKLFKIRLKSQKPQQNRSHKTSFTGLQLCQNLFFYGSRSSCRQVAVRLRCAVAANSWNSWRLQQRSFGWQRRLKSRSSMNCLCLIRPKKVKIVKQYIGAVALWYDLNKLFANLSFNEWLPQYTYAYYISQRITNMQ